MREAAEQNGHPERISLQSERMAALDGSADVYDQILRTAVQMVDADAATMRLFDLRTGTLKIVKGHNVSAGFLSQPSIRLGQGIAGRVVMEERPYSTANVATEPLCVNRDFARAEGITCMMNAPLKAGESTLGCITVYRKRTGEFTEQDLMVLGIFASQSAAAVARTRFLEDLQRQAVHDPLTGVYTKSAVLRELDARILLAARHRQQVSVLFIDIDNFRSFNEMQGRLLGDKMLCDLAAVLRSQCRRSDVIGRYGGDEFLVVAPHTARSGAVRLAAKLLDAARRHRFSGTGGYVHMTLSAGIAASPRDAKNVDELIEKADTAMYEAKRAGKRQVLCWDAKQRP